MKKLIIFTSLHSFLGASFAYACGLEGLFLALSGFCASVLHTYKGRLSAEVTPWFLLFLAGALFGNHFLLALSAGPLSVLVVRFFSCGITFMGLSISKEAKTKEIWTGLLLLSGWILLGWISRLNAIILMVDRQPFLIDPGKIVSPISILGPLAMTALLPGTIKKGQQKAGPELSRELDFTELSRNWLNENRREAQEPVVKRVLDNSKQEEIFKATGPHRQILNTFWHECVMPHIDIFKEFSLVPVLRELLTLLDIHGGVPSVRKKDQKDRVREDNQYDILAKIPLSIHSVNVARNVLETVRERFPDNVSLHLPGLLVAALGHDIGKLEIISGQKYVTGQHPVDGAKYMEEHLMNGHPWALKVAEFVRRHHEAVLDRTPVDLAILIRADKNAREQELRESGNMETSPEKPGEAVSYEAPAKKETSIAFPPKIESIPGAFPVDEIFDRLREITNVMLPNRTWVSFSQPDGTVYVQAETLHEIISRLAQEAGFADAFFHATDKETKKSCLQSFYEEFRKRDWVPEKLVGAGFYGNFFWVWNPVSRRKIRTFYMPVKAEALKAEPSELEAERQAHAILASVKVLGVAIPGKKY